MKPLYILIASLSLGIAPLFAQEVAPGGELADRVDAPAPQVDPQASFRDPDRPLPELLAAIAAERAALQERAKALDLREAEIAFAGAALSEQETRLTALQAEISRLLTVAESNHTNDVARLVRLYRSMKPAEAAAILSEADLEVSVLVIAAMLERDAGPILARMNQTRAHAISKIILERSRLPGDQRLINVKVN